MQLEHQQREGKLTLQRLWFYLQPTLHHLRRLRTLCKVHTQQVDREREIDGLRFASIPLLIGCFGLPFVTVSVSASPSLFLRLCVCVSAIYQWACNHTGGSLLNVIYKALLQEG